MINCKLCGTPISGVHGEMCEKCREQLTKKYGTARRKK